ncbi:MAG: hypothetical protein K2N41_01365, partial [Lachnospiraceae bacterium]|nr:hypothetical protein [Lachnospiraceae bacterium]
MEMESAKITNLYDLEKTIAAELFEGKTYPWELLPQIGEFIISLGERLDKSVYEERESHVWVAKSAKVFDSAYIGAPCIGIVYTNPRPR